MKNQPIALCIISTLMILFVSSCTNSPTSTPQASEIEGSSTPTNAPTATAAATETEAPATAQIVATETILVEETVLPTPTPEPIACTIAFDTDVDGNREIYSMAADGSNPVNLSNQPADDFDPAWSPDGSQIAFVSNRENDTPGQYIYVMNADGSLLRQLTYEDGSDFPDWSHDGSALTYTSNGDIYVIKADGSGTSVNLTNSPENEHHSSWSPDGRQLLYTSGEDQNQNIYVMNPDGSNIFQITNNGQNYEASWTIDNRIFTGWGWKDQEQTCYNCVVNSDGSDIRDAGGKGMLRRYFPFWTVDGNRVECVSVNLNESPTADIYLVGEIFPEVLHNLTNSEANEINVDWPATCGQEVMKIGYAGDDPSTQQRLQSFQRACDEEALLCPSGSIPDLMAQGVDAIVLNSVNGVPQEDNDTIQKALDAGIPVFLLDAEIDLPEVYSVTIDQAKWAQTSLKWMFEKMGGKGQFLFFDVNQSFHHGEVIEQMLAEYPEVTVVGRGGGADFDPFWVKPQTADYLINNPELKAVWTNTFWDGAIQGVAEESGADPDKWPLLVCEASFSGMEYWSHMLELNPKFDCIAVGNPSGIAYDAFYAAYFLLNGEEIDPSRLAGRYGRSLLVDFPVATSENRQEMLDNNPNLDQFMSPEEIMDQWFDK